MPKKKALVIFRKGEARFSGGDYDEVISGERLKNFMESGSIYEAAAFVEELSKLTFPNGKRVAKSFLYRGYELWWFRYNGLYLQFALPYTQFKKLLDYLKNFQEVHLLNPTSEKIFSTYLEAHGVKVKKLGWSLRFGVILQGFISLVSLPLIVLMRGRLILFIGDKFEKGTDHDFRMRYIYEGLRARKIIFREFIRSLESSKAVLSHALFRLRPVIYSEAVFMLGQVLSIFTGGRRRGRKLFNQEQFKSLSSMERFKLSLAMMYLPTIYDDVWAIRIMRFLFKLFGTRVVFIAAALERNFHAFVGAKTAGLPTVGILHGVASPFYNVYDFLPAYDGGKRMTVDKYGVWSEWWKELYLKNGPAYAAEQLVVTGPMRPFFKTADTNTFKKDKKDKIKVLFISEQLAWPSEVPPYLERLLSDPECEVYLKVRAYRDGFEDWLKLNRPEILEKVKVLRGTMQETIQECDVVVGSHSTAVLEALLQLKPPVFYDTRKWGDYYDLNDYPSQYHFFARNPEELLAFTKESLKVPENELRKLQERFFGDPYKNGSDWVVEELVKYLD